MAADKKKLTKCKHGAFFYTILVLLSKELTADVSQIKLVKY